MSKVSLFFLASAVMMMLAGDCDGSAIPLHHFQHVMEQRGDPDTFYPMDPFHMYRLEASKMKREPVYGFGLGKKDPAYNFGLGKRSPKIALPPLARFGKKK